MPLFLLIAGIILLTAAIRNKQDLLFATLKDDFTGPNNFLYWGLSIFVITFVGYYKPLKPLSNAFLVLVIIILFLSHRGFFESFMAQIRETQHRRQADDMVKFGVGVAKSIFGV